MNPTATPEQFLNIKEVVRRTTLSRVTIWRLVREAKFPKARRITPGRVAWLESELLEWMRLGISGWQKR